MTRRAFSQGKTTAIAWAAAGLTLVVCGVGMRITYLQYRAVRHLILESNRESAQRVRSMVATRLVELERDLLEELARDSVETGALSRGVVESSVVESPFFVSASGSLRNPLLPRLPPGAPMMSEDPMPRDFEAALRQVWSAEPSGAKLETLKRLSRSTGLAEHWRLRASSLIAALHAKEGRPADAAASYRKLFADFRKTILENPRPTYLHLTLAYAESLLETQAPAELRAVLGQTLDLLHRGVLRTTTEQELFFLRRARALYAEARQTPPDVLERLTRRQEEERQVLAVAAAVRNRKDAADRLVGGGPGEPRRFYEVVDRRPVLAVWNAVKAPGEDGVAAAGFVADPTAVAREATRILASSGAGSPFIVMPRSASTEETDSFIPLVPLEESHGFLEICLPREKWDEQVGQARRPFLFAGGAIGFLAVALITCLVVIQRGVKQELLLSRMKTEFVANVSHELKTPLSLIRMFAETLLLGRVSDESQQKKYYNIITRESERLSHLISNVLNFSSIEAGKKGYQMRRLHLGPVIEEVVESYRYGLEAKGFELHTELDDDLPEVAADPEAVSQAVINLLENSIKYSPKDKDLRLSVRAVGGSVEITLSDRGVGIAPEDQKRVLEDYYRTREARALGTRGSGLGLSVVQHIMEAHSGTVRLTSQPGEGSCFTLVFPVARSTPPAETENDRPEPVSEMPVQDRGKREK